MSILQEYEIIRRKIGESEYHSICEFLKEYPMFCLNDVYYNLNKGYEMYKKWKLKKMMKNL